MKEYLRNHRRLSHAGRRPVRCRSPTKIIIISIFLAYISPARAQDFNSYILKSVDYLYNNYSKRGYDISSAFTHDIIYGSKGTIPALKPANTMCVAAVAEVIIQAINIYAHETNDMSVYDKIPLDAWTRGNILSLRANIFMFSGTGSRGTGYTLSEFGIGEELRFQDLKPGDFVNLNRQRTGHSVVFIGYLYKDLRLVFNYSPDVVGFRYFSAQGKGRPDAGLGYRNGFFDGFCPDNSPVPRDCGIIRSNNRALLDTGRMWSPPQWGFLQAVASRRSHTRAAIEDANPDVSRGIIEDLLNEELRKDLEMSPAQTQVFDGITTD